MGKGSPYLTKHRLSDIMAAIQVLGASNWQSLKSETWEEDFGPPQSEPKDWYEIFKEHPEFFRIEDSPRKVSMRWRFAFEKSFDARMGREYTVEERNALDPAQRKDLTRRPLTADQITALMTTAMDLHSRALLQLQDSRWMIPIASSFAGGVVGAVVGALLKH